MPSGMPPWFRDSYPFGLLSANSSNKHHQAGTGHRALTLVLGVQVQYSLLDRRPENGMAEFCHQRGIKLLPYGVVGGGLLSDKYFGMPAAQ